MPKSRVRVGWVIRAVLGLSILALAVAAMASQQPMQPSAPSATTTPMAVQVAAGNDPLPTFVPTATRQPFVERIISRVSRETPAPYPTSTPPPDGLAVVSVVDFGFLPSMTRIHAGQTVLWTNGGRELHDVTGTDDWHSGPIEPASEYRRTFSVPGTFNYRCTVHLDMTGTIIVSA